MPARPGRAAEVMERSGIERVFLTNEPDEDLSGVDRSLFVPSLRTDGLVLKLHEPAVRAALAARSRAIAEAEFDGSRLAPRLASLLAGMAKV